MVKGKGNIFGKKESKLPQEEVQRQDGSDAETIPADAENMSADQDVITDEGAIEPQKEESPSQEDVYKAQVKEIQEKYIRLMAEFDNFRKRSLKERTDLIKSAGEDILVNILPIMDDFERGLTAMETSQDVEAVKQGVLLIYNKFKDFLAQRGVKEIDAAKQDFNVDLHEALTKIPAPAEDLKGKVVDVVQKGYCLNDKVIRYAKVVVGE